MSDVENSDGARDSDDTVFGEPDPEDAGRQLFAYLGGREWREYRAILGVFAGTFFAEFTPEDVISRLAADGVRIDAEVVQERLESLRRWGNLVVSSSVGSPTSLADYYRRRNRYLITSAGQDVYDMVETVLGRVDEVQDVSASRLRTLLEALRTLRALDLASVDPERLADRVGEVFAPHEDFTGEITRFFATLNQWQARFDLNHDELAFFAQVLVTYVADQLDEIDRVSRPIAALVDELLPDVPLIIDRVARGLAGRVEESGMGGAVTVTHRSGTAEADWDHLRAWFCSTDGRPARLLQLRSDAIAAIRTLTMNLTRLSRVGVGGASRRADLIRFAALLDRSDPRVVPKLVQAGFGLGGSIHWANPSADVDDPVPAGIPWAEAPPAIVPVSLRERGDRTSRGSSSPMTDRSVGQRLIRQRREAEREALRRVDDELACVSLDGATVSTAALHRLQTVVGAALARMGPRADSVEHVDGRLRCAVKRTPGADLTVSTPDGTLTFTGLGVSIGLIAEVG